MEDKDSNEREWSTAARPSKIRTDGSISKIDIVDDFMYSSFAFLEESPSQINNAW